MKKAIVISALAVLASLSVYGQGHVNFRTHTAPDDRVRNPDGSLVAGAAGYRAELVYAPDGTSPGEFATTAVRLGLDTAVGTPVAGSIQAGSRTAPITRDDSGNPSPGGFALFQVRVWRPADGATYDAVVRTGNPAFLVAETPIMRADTGNHLAPQPELATELPLPTSVGGGGLTLHPVPEPSVIGLGLLGVGALLMLRRRK